MSNITNITFSKDINDYAIHHNGWSGKWNINEVRPAEEHKDFVLWLVDEVLNSDTLDGMDYEAEEWWSDNDYICITFSGQPIIDKASFPIYNDEEQEEARGFQLLVKETSISYTL